MFVSNLLFIVDEEQLKSTFSPVSNFCCLQIFLSIARVKTFYFLVFLKLGEIEEIRLVKNLQGASRGYAYVQFKNEVNLCSGWSNSSSGAEEGGGAGGRNYFSSCYWGGGGGAPLPFYIIALVQESKKL